MIKFSIIVPLYNKAPYVRKALESIVAQTYRDWECIIVNDGSTDDSLEVVNKYIQSVNSEERIVNSIRIISQTNSGVAAARNRGVKDSKGEYVCFLDADDWWDKDFLMTMSEAIDTYPHAGVYGVNYYTVRNGVATKILTNIETGVMNYFKVYSCPPYAMPLCVGSVAIPRNVFNEVDGFNPIMKMAEDFDLWVRIALRYPVYYTDKALAYYNQDVQVKWRAIGKLVDPEHHFVFNADYLQPEMTQNIDLRHAVEMVKIVCLRQYYLSNRYYKLAQGELQKIRLDDYRDKSFASYIWKPRWKERVKFYLYTIITTIRNR